MKKWICREWLPKHTGRYRGNHPPLVICREEVIEAQTRKEALILFREKSLGPGPKFTASPLTKKK
jgi:hypothetical protein